MKARWIGILLVLALAAVLAPPASAQLNQTGTLMGTVSDNQKQPLPGVTVSIKSPAMIVPHMDTITSAQGMYRFLSLPPGSYEITFTLDGMNTVVRGDIKVGIGQTTTIDVTLEQKTLVENVTVVGKSPTIDIKSTAKSTVLDRTFLTVIPAARNLDALMNMAPGVTAEPNNGNGLMSSVNGSGVRDNAFNLDGVNMAAQDVGTMEYQFGVDIIEEMAVVSGGMPAEYGDAMGAAVNIVTRQGGNKMSGSLSAYYNSLHLQSNNTNGTPLAGSKSGYQYIFEPGVTLGGPIIKDKLWFFVNLSYNDRSRLIAGFPYDDPGSVQARETRYYPYAKLSFQPSQSDRFTFSYAFTNYVQDHAGADPTYLESATIDWTSPTHVFNLQWMKTFSSSFFGDFKVSFLSNQQNLLPKGTQPIIIDIATGLVSGDYLVKDLYTNKRIQANAHLTYFVDSWGGSHEFKAGADLDTATSTRSFHPNADPRSGASEILSFYGTPLMGFVATNYDNVYVGTSFHGFIQDSWKPTKRLTLNLGLRITDQIGRIPVQNESEGPQSFLGYTFNRSVTTAFNAFNRTALAPRLGLIYDLTGDGKTLLKASYSRYLQSNLIQYFTETNPNNLFYYIIALMPNGYPIPGAYLGLNIPTTAKVGYNGSGLKTPYTDEFAIGLERELVADLSLSARYSRRQDRNLVEDVDANQLDINALMTNGTLDWSKNWTQVSYVDPYNSQTGTMWSQKAVLSSDLYLVNPPGLKRDFDGFELTLTKRYSRGWFLSASYVWQHARGQVGTEWFASGGITNLYNNPNAHINTYGDMHLERKNQFKVQGVVEGPWGIVLSGFFRYFSGQRYERQVDSTDLGIPLAQGDTIINAEAMGSREMPAQMILDLRLEKGFKLGGAKFSVFADGFNVFNANKATDVWYRSSSAAIVFEQMRLIMDPRAVRLGARFEF